MKERGVSRASVSVDERACVFSGDLEDASERSYAASCRRRRPRPDSFEEEAWGRGTDVVGHRGIERDRCTGKSVVVGLDSPAWLSTWLSKSWSDSALGGGRDRVIRLARTARAAHRCPAEVPSTSSALLSFARAGGRRPRTCLVDVVSANRRSIACQPMSAVAMIQRRSR
jgi:hypothetical protein